MEIVLKILAIIIGVGLGMGATRLTIMYQKYRNKKGWERLIKHMEQHGATPSDILEAKTLSAKNY